LVRRLSAAAGGVAVALLLSACGTGGPVNNAAADKENGRKVFAEKCAGCHTLAAAGAQGRIGPNLDSSFAEARSEGFKESAILDIVHDQIKFPGQYPVRQSNPDFLKANMPANVVTGQDAIDVSAFVAANAGLQGFAEAQAASGTNGKQIFITKCGGCHTLKAAGTTGTQGPNLDLLKPPLQRVKNQVIKGGAIMPAFKGVLTDAQINAVAKYVADHAGKP
jgi:cbb3-type cytochrome c oxidase subunit III